MIVKRIKRNSSSSFGKLADYILDHKNQGAKVKEAWTTNCCDDLEIAVAEITAKQSLNTRARSDKTYHLVISFPAGEIPGSDQLKDIESTLCASIGFAEHSRISAAHHDTDNYHLHLAISKIHPKTLRMHEPYYDKFKLQEVSRQLEIKHGLKRLQSGIEPQKDIIEFRQGKESFESWLVANLKPELKIFLQKPDRNWETFHKILQERGVVLRPNGAGFVFSHISEKLYVKASSIDRAFGKKALETNLGPHTPQQTDYKVLKQYRDGPAQKTSTADSLYTLYKFERQYGIDRRATRRQDAWNKRVTETGKIFASYAKRREEVARDWLLHPGQKRNVYAALQQAMKKELEQVRLEHQRERERITKTNSPPPPWSDWLRKRALWDNASLEVLRSKRKEIPYALENKIVGRASAKPNAKSELTRLITKDGGIQYTLPNKTSFIDRGQAVHVMTSDPATIEAAVKHSIQKFGHNITFEGSPSFTTAAKEVLTRAIGEQVKSRGMNRSRGPEI